MLSKQLRSSNQLFISVTSGAVIGRVIFAGVSGMCVSHFQVTVFGRHGAARTSIPLRLQAVRDSMDCPDKMKVIFGKVLAAMEARPKHDVLKPATFAAPALRRIVAVADSIVDKADEHVVNSTSLLESVAETCLELSISIVWKAVTSAGGGLKGGTNGQPWHHGFAQEPEPEAVKGILKLAEQTLLAVDHEALDTTTTSLIKAVRHYLREALPTINGYPGVSGRVAGRAL
jgi:hypothetical protein